MLSKQMKVALVVVMGWIALAAVHAADTDVAGVWAGTWEGGGSGGSIQLTITKTGDALGGKVEVGQDTGDYDSTFSAASWEGGKFTARYPYTPEPQADIVLEGTFDGATGKGTWTMVPTGGTEPFAAGSWSVSKK